MNDVERAVRVWDETIGWSTQKMILQDGPTKSRGSVPLDVAESQALVKARLNDDGDGVDYPRADDITLD